MLEFNRPPFVGRHRTMPVLSRPGTWPPRRKRRKGANPGVTPAAPKPSSSTNGASRARRGPVR